MRIAYFDCFNGAGGDMLVGALLDAGASADRLRDGLRSLNAPDLSVHIEKVTKQGFAATRFVVTDGAPPPRPAAEQHHPHGEHAHDHDHHHHDHGHKPHRHLRQVRKLIEAANLPQRVRDRAIATFERLADAEAAAHGIDREKVHFHEVGAVDAIADVVGAMLALEELAVERCICSPLPVGSGTVKCEHGIMPVPAPATALLLKGVPIAPSMETGELLTPTAAAVLTTLCTEFGPMPAMTIQSVGLGAGTREGKTLPNVTRVLIGEMAAASASDTVAVLEANLDDATGEQLGFCLSRLMDAGALDAYFVPVYMKKNRPGVVLTVLCAPAKVAEFEAIIFAETPTLGIRRHTASRSKLDRRHETVQTSYGPIRIKIGSRDGQTLSASPEYEDCASAAKTANVALRVVMDAATHAWRKTSTE